MQNPEHAAKLAAISEEWTDAERLAVIYHIAREIRLRRPGDTLARADAIAYVAQMSPAFLNDNRDNIGRDLSGPVPAPETAE